jgi:cellulose synthase/poly-beta-1,6-N-acetylglucosamine synthase-like glycosyltransferase
VRALWELWAWLNSQAGWLFLGGLVVVVCWNGYKWRQDRALAWQLRGRELEPVQLPSTPKVSVLVAAWNEAHIIGEHIASFMGLRHPNKELVLCAGGADGTFELARQYAGEHVLVLEQRPGQGKQRALQRCLSRASGAIIFLTDADCLLDDDSFGQTLAPLLLDSEVIATGTSRPLGQQLGNPFVVYQWCTNLFADARRPGFVSGILGRNCALTRKALERIGGFSAEVPTGTDYHAAKLLLRHGYGIRYVRNSVVETRYPETFRSYWRRQSRWVRNLMVHGPAFGAYDELAMALKTSLAGWSMLLLPFVSLAAGLIILAVWGVLLGQALLAKVRYAHFASLYRRIDISMKQYALTPPYVFVDFIAWSLPLVDLLTRRYQW